MENKTKVTTEIIAEDKEKNPSKSWTIINKIWEYTDWIWWVILGFFLRTVLVNLGLYTECPLIDECTRCFTYNNPILGQINNISITG